MLFTKMMALSIILTASVMAQSFNLKGRVLEKVGMKPVPGAIVQIAGGGLKATTDADGKFTLQGATALDASGVKVLLSAPFFQAGYLMIPSVRATETVRIELFNFSGSRVSDKIHPLATIGWNRVQILPDLSQDFMGFVKISTESTTWVKRVLSLNTHLALPWTSELAQAGKGLAKAAAGNLEVSCEKLVKKTVAFTADNMDVGDIILEYPPRKMDVGVAPIYGAQVLFDGSKGKAAAQAELLAKWKDWPRFSPSDIKFKIAKDPQYPNDTNKVTLQSCCNTNWGFDDIQAIAVHGDAQIHVEFNGMGEYDATENTNATDAIDESPVKPGYFNSGVYVQSRYEVQIRAFSQNKSTLPGNHDMASLVDDYSPTANVNRPNGEWQAYDITFRSARYDGSGKKVENARISLWWNGVQVHNNRDARAPATGTSPGSHSGEELDATLYGIKLQSEGRDLRYRNIWIKELTLPTAETNFGY